jgi:hypothetical protein
MGGTPEAVEIAPGRVLSECKRLEHLHLTLSFSDMFAGQQDALKGVFLCRGPLRASLVSLDKLKSLGKLKALDIR